MPAPPPTCLKCGSDHYRFVRCEDADEWNEKHAERQQQRLSPKVENWSVPAGSRVWTGDKTPSWDVRGNLWRRRET